MTPAAEIRGRLIALGVVFSRRPVAGRPGEFTLHVDAPEGVLGPTIVAALKLFKAELLALLAEGERIEPIDPAPPLTTLTPPPPPAPSPTPPAPPPRVRPTPRAWVESEADRAVGAMVLRFLWSRKGAPQTERAIEEAIGLGPRLLPQLAEMESAGCLEWAWAFVDREDGTTDKRFGWRMTGRTEPYIYQPSRRKAGDPPWILGLESPVDLREDAEPDPIEELLE